MIAFVSWNIDIPWKIVCWQQDTTDIKPFFYVNSSSKLIVSAYASMANLSRTGGRLNKKDGLTRCGDSHVKDKTS